VITPWENLSDVVAALKAGSLEPEMAEVTMMPSNSSPCDSEQAEKVLRLIDALEELDDVQNVYSNADFPDELIPS
jgi:transcriptional/translational regulatory protein YebC/TACO1